MRIAVLNHSTAASDEEVARWVAAIQVQIGRDVYPLWRFGADLRFVASAESVDDEEWQIVLTDSAEEADYLGYHDEDAQGKPRGFVFIKTTLESGGNPSTTLSHEVLEMLGNPWLDACAMGPTTSRRVVSYELCDPVEGDEYEIDGVKVSNFVTPAYFDTEAQGPFDFLRRLKSAFALTEGGYLIVWNSRQGWHDVFAAKARTKQPRSRTSRIKQVNRGK